MNDTANPTALRIGMTGTLCGVRYRVVGRVVVGMEEEGETYCWNEFHLLDDSGQSATLVFEETEAGPEWKLFMLFDPTRPISVAEAALKQVGDAVNLDGTNVRVTLVSESRVYHIEGRAPEGVETGDVATYFNAEGGGQMQVVSWTGDEVECYRGMNLSTHDVTNAFGIAQPPVIPSSGLAFTESDQPTSSSSGTIVKAISVALSILLGLASYSHFRSPRPPSAAPKKPKTRVSPLNTGVAGTLGAKYVTVDGHAVVEIVKVGGIYDWYEYRFRDDDGLLICGLNGYDTQWYLLRPVQPFTSMTPTQAAALRGGDTLTLGEHALKVHTVFQSRVLSVDDQHAPGAVMFGFIANSGNDWAVVRWTQNEIEFCLGTSLTEPEVLTAFGVVTKR